jgi:carbamoyl-phosphate synthase small subunit
LTLKSDLLAGFSIKDDKVLATAFNPEGSPGNFDAASIYDQFLNMME